MSHQFKCAGCGGIFRTTTNDEEALVEAAKYFGDLPPEDRVEICEDCWQELHPAKHPVELELWRREREELLGGTGTNR